MQNSMILASAMRINIGKQTNFIYMDQDKSHPKEDRRAGMDRRHFSFAIHIPERRSGLDRRKNIVPEHSKKSADQNNSDPRLR
jgi:hypothetical protein